MGLDLGLTRSGTWKSYSCHAFCSVQHPRRTKRGATAQYLSGTGMASLDTLMMVVWYLRQFVVGSVERFSGAVPQA